MMNLIENSMMSEKSWRGPPHRFIEWGPEDESYLRAANYGEEVDVAYRVGDVIVAHPTVVARIRATLTHYNGDMK